MVEGTGARALRRTELGRAAPPARRTPKWCRGALGFPGLEAQPERPVGDKAYADELAEALCARRNKRVL